MTRSQSEWPKEPEGLQCQISLNATMEQIAALGPERADAFMLGVAKCVAAGNPAFPGLRPQQQKEEGA